MQQPMMKCGHSANATDENGKPVCAICVGIIKGACEIDENLPNLIGRQAKCRCGAIQPSKLSLPFFKHQPEQEFDSFYCGHYGWD